MSDDSEPAYTAPQQGHRCEKGRDRSRSRGKGLFRSIALGRGRRARQRGCATSRTSCIALFFSAGPSLPATAGPSTSLTGPSNSSTGMDPFGVA